MGQLSCVIFCKGCPEADSSLQESQKRKEIFFRLHFRFVKATATIRHKESDSQFGIVRATGDNGHKDRFRLSAIVN